MSKEQSCDAGLKNQKLEKFDYLFLIMFLNLILVGFLVFHCCYGGSLQASTDMVMPTNFHDLKMSKI